MNKQTELLACLYAIESMTKKAIALITEDMSYEPIAQSQLWNIKKIRQFLVEGFSEAELRSFCHVYHTFFGNEAFRASLAGTQSIVHALLDYADRHNQINVLLGWAKTQNPAKYQHFEPFESQHDN